MVKLDKLFLAALMQTGIFLPSIIFLLMGSVFSMPGLLQEDTNDTQSFSTMRFMVLTVAIVFAAITIKIGWQTSSFEEFKIHDTWVYILGLAFGGKVAQKFTESSEEDTTPPKDETPPKGDGGGGAV